MEIQEKAVYLVDGTPFMCIAKNDQFIIMAGYYSDDEDAWPELHMNDVLVYDAVNPDYGPIEKIGNYQGSVIFEER